MNFSDKILILLSDSAIYLVRILHFAISSFYIGYHLTMEYLKKPTDITAFVGTTDMIAIGIIDALTNSGFKIPKDFSVCGFDNSVASSFANISLTTVDHSIEDKGISAVEMLTKQHETKSKDKKNSAKKKPLLRLEYEPQLIIRGSSGKRK